MRRTSAASSARSTSAASRSIASTTSSCRRTTACSGSPKSSACAIASASARPAVGFYDDGRLFSMTTLAEFLRFPILAPHDRIRLAAFVARCQLTRPRPAGRRSARGLAAPHVRPAHGRAAVEAAPRLQVRRPLLRFAGDVHLGAHAAHVEDARLRRPRGDGLARGRLPDADRRARAPIRELGGEVHAGTGGRRHRGHAGRASTASSWKAASARSTKCSARSCRRWRGD